MTTYEPREHIIDAELASGNLDAWKQVLGFPRAPRFTPATCPHCEYDRRFPDTKTGGWMYMGNGAPIMCCPVCNPDGKHPRP